MRTFRTRSFAGWLLPTAVLVLLPKCPACFAAYLLIGTGLSISLSGALYLRMFVILLCMTALSWFAIRVLTRIWRRQNAPQAMARDS